MVTLRVEFPSSNQGDKEDSNEQQTTRPVQLNLNPTMPCKATKRFRFEIEFEFEFLVRL
jgi:hypothetical protein